ncbi:MAG TPA: hypothetical protein VNS58_11310 [Puia sp.]|nr:hypothetical protein [Puia sp.]
MIGGFIGSSAGFEAARLLKPYLEIEWGRKVSKGFFFRAEDFSHFINAVERGKSKIEKDLSELRGQVDDSIIEKMSESMNYSLSPLKQLSLIALVLEVLKKGNTQFIIATHSPILMGMPDATLYEVQEDGMQQVKYKETDHYRITKTFLDNPEYYLRHLK